MRSSALVSICSQASGAVETATSCSPAFLTRCSGVKEPPLPFRLNYSFLFESLKKQQKTKTTQKQFKCCIVLLILPEYYHLKNPFKNLGGIMHGCQQNKIQVQLQSKVKLAGSETHLFLQYSWYNLIPDIEKKKKKLTSLIMKHVLLQNLSVYCTWKCLKLMNFV